MVKDTTAPAPAASAPAAAPTPPAESKAPESKPAEAKAVESKGTKGTKGKSSKGKSGSKPTQASPPTGGKPATGGRLSSIEADLEAWGIDVSDLAVEGETYREADETAPELDEPDQMEPPGIDPFDGEEVESIVPEADDLLSLDFAELPEGADPSKPANKGVPPMHELERRGLVPDDVMAHVREYRRGYTHAKQEAAALRKELAAMKGQAPEAPASSGPVIPFSDDYSAKIRELAATTVDPASMFTAEGAALAAKVEAAKLLLPQIEHAEKLRSQHEEERAKVEAQTQAKQWVADNPWVMTPGIKEATAEYIKAGMDLEAAAWRAYGEHQMKQSSTEADKARAARQAALSKTAGRRTTETPTSSRRGKSGVEFYQEELARRGT